LEIDDLHRQLRSARHRHRDSGGEIDVCVLATMFGAIDWGFRVILVTDALCGSADGNARCRDECLHEPVRQQVETVTTKTLLESW